MKMMNLEKPLENTYEYNSDEIEEDENKEDDLMEETQKNIMLESIESLQKALKERESELSKAQLKIRQYESGELQVRQNSEFNCCEHEEQNLKLQQLVAVKDAAIKEAISQRNKLKLDLQNMKRNTGNQIEENCLKSSEKNLTPAKQETSGRFNIADSLWRARLDSITNEALERPKRYEKERFDKYSIHSPKNNEHEEAYWLEEWKKNAKIKNGNAFITNSHCKHNTCNSSLSSSNLSNNSPRCNGDPKVPKERFIGISNQQHELVKEFYRVIS